jgi:hypothetical protein
MLTYYFRDAVCPSKGLRVKRPEGTHTFRYLASVIGF